MFSKTEVIVAQIVTTQLHHCIIITVSNQSTTNLPKLTIYQNSWLSFRSKSSSKMSSARRFLRLLKRMAPVLNIDFIHAVLEAISCLVL